LNREPSRGQHSNGCEALPVRFLHPGDGKSRGVSVRVTGNRLTGARSTGLRFQFQPRSDQCHPVIIANQLTSEHAGAMRFTFTTTPINACLLTTAPTVTAGQEWDTLQRSGPRNKPDQEQYFQGHTGYSVDGEFTGLWKLDLQ